MKIKKIFVLAASILFLGGCNSFNDTSSSQQVESTTSDSAISQNDATSSNEITNSNENSSDSTSDYTSENSSIEVVEKVATINVVGVDTDQLNAQIATVIATTRQAPESVGTAFKTIYARINGFKAGTDDAEIS